MIGLFACFALVASGIEITLATSMNASFPSLYSGSSSRLVRSNFFGISIELSIINTLIGENVSSITPQIENYFSYIQTRAKNPVRIRVGGNSMDDSVFNSSQDEMIIYTGEAASTNDQPVSYGPDLFDVLAKIAKNIGGAQYLMGLSLLLRDENNEPLIVSTTEQKLGSYLDGFLLGNEPDLYGPDGRRQSNYSIQDYFEEFAAVSQQLNSSSQYGNLIPGSYLGGPTICCNWALADILKQGYLTDFGSELKYINLQHYAQTNCFGTNGTIPYYTSHYNVVSLAEWQLDGIEAAQAANKPIVMGEFNTASCGGIPGISDTFAATLWTLDYVLQLASAGYDGAFIHTRERGITYNLFDPPPMNDSTSGWTTLPTFYALLPAAEALSAGWKNGSYVVDLMLNNNSESSVVAGYGIYDGQTSAVSALVFFNYADTGENVTTFSILSDGKSMIFMRTLTAASLVEKYNISWAGKTFQGVSDGIMVDSGFAPDQEVSCGATCDFQVPSPGAAVVWFDSSLVPSETDPDFSSTSGKPHTSHVPSQTHPFPNLFGLLALVYFTVFLF